MFWRLPSGSVSFFTFGVWPSVILHKKPSFALRGAGGGGGEFSSEVLVEVCDSVLQTLKLFLTIICNFCTLFQTKTAQKLHRSFGTTDTYIAYIGEYTPPPPASFQLFSSAPNRCCYLKIACMVANGISENMRT